MPKPDPVTIRIGPAEAGVRLDRLLRKLLPETPLSAVHRMIRRGEVRLDGARAKASARLAAGSALSLVLPEADAEALRARVAAGGEPGAGARDGTGAAAMPLLHQDAHVLAFDKPAGVAAHPGSGHPLETTVLGALYARVGRGTATFTPALVGRLDRDTSGVQLAGVSPEGLRGLSALSRARGIAKVYLALVRGEDIPDKGRIDSPLVDTKRGRARMRALSPGETAGGALEAVTEYRVLARGRGATLVEVLPETGRRHQIRAHFFVNAPLAGDVRYGDKGWNRELAGRTGLRRLFLHCSEARLRHPVTGLALEIRSPLPPELERALEALGISV